MSLGKSDRTGGERARPVATGRRRREAVVAQADAVGQQPRIRRDQDLPRDARSQLVELEPCCSRTGRRPEPSPPARCASASEVTRSTATPCSSSTVASALLPDLLAEVGSSGSAGPAFDQRDDDRRDDQQADHREPEPGPAPGRRDRGAGLHGTPVAQSPGSRSPSVTRAAHSRPRCWWWVRPDARGSTASAAARAGGDVGRRSLVGRRTTPRRTRVVAVASGRPRRSGSNGPASRAVAAPVRPGRGVEHAAVLDRLDGGPQPLAQRLGPSARRRVRRRPACGGRRPRRAQRVVLVLRTRARAVRLGGPARTTAKMITATTHDQDHQRRRPLRRAAEQLVEVPHDPRPDPGRQARVVAVVLGVANSCCAWRWATGPVTGDGGGAATREPAERRQARASERRPGDRAGRGLHRRAPMDVGCCALSCSTMSSPSLRIRRSTYSSASMPALSGAVSVADRIPPIAVRTISPIGSPLPRRTRRTRR